MSISSLLSSKGIYLNNYMDERSEYQIGSAQAKTEYFLTPDDLATLQCERPGGWGAGPSRYYCSKDLERCALRKFGEEGLADKRAKRDKRVANKRKREDDAKKAEAELGLVSANNTPARCAVPGGAPKPCDGASRQSAIDLTGPGGFAPPAFQPAPAGIGGVGAGNSNAAPLAPAADVPEVACNKAVACLRTEARKMLKQYMSWDYMRSKNSPHSAYASMQIGRVEQKEYAALVGRKNDPLLRSVVKSGAWYSTTCDMRTFFGTELDKAGYFRGSGGRYGCNKQIGLHMRQTLVLKYSPSNKTMSVGFEVKHLSDDESDDDF